MKSTFTLLLFAILIALMCQTCLVSANDNLTASSLPVEKEQQALSVTKIEEKADRIIEKLRSSLRGSGSTCRLENTSTYVKTFICDLSFEKKIAFKKVKVSGTLTMVAHLTKQKIQIKFSAAGNSIYNSEFDMGLVNLDPICVDLITSVGFCLQVRNMRFALDYQCVGFDIEGYFKAFGLKESVLKQPIGYNINKC